MNFELQGIGSEARLLLDAVRSALGVEQPTDVGDVDWGRWQALVERHGLGPLLNQEVEHGRLRQLPMEVRARLWARSASTERRNTELADELATVVRSLAAARVQVIPYKGPTLAARAYGTLGAREFGDLDLLVAKDDVRRAQHALEQLGYRPLRCLSLPQQEALVRSRRDYELGLLHATRRILVELHWRGDPDVDLPPLDCASWWQAQPQTEVAGACCRTLSSEDLVLVLCLHGTKHLWSSLGWLVDVIQLVHREPQIDWTRVRDVARANGCLRRVQLALVLAQDLFGVHLAGSVVPLDEVAVHRMAQLIEQRSFCAEEPSLSTMQALRFRLQACDGMRQRLGVLWRAATQPGWGEWLLIRLPRPLFFLYWPLRPLRLFAKYVLRIAPREAALPPRLEDDHGHGVGQVEAAIARPHRQP